MRLRRFYGTVASDQNQSILRLVTGERILELGCGYGTFIQEAEDKGKEVIGLDIDFKVLEIGRSLYPSLLTKLVQGTWVASPLRTNHFMPSS
jgi:SAM-dependent methyltransferase